jgi:hypothetical protein
VAIENLPPGYDSWRTREPEVDTYVIDVDDLDDEGNPPTEIDDEMRERCVLGGACLNVDPMHRSDECFDAAMMDAFYAELERAS